MLVLQTLSVLRSSQPATARRGVLLSARRVLFFFDVLHIIIFCFIKVLSVLRSSQPAAARRGLGVSARRLLFVFFVCDVLYIIKNCVLVLQTLSVLRSSQPAIARPGLVLPPLSVLGLLKTKKT